MPSERIALLRHFNSIDRLIELGGTIDEFTSLQPKGSRWDFWKEGKPRIDVVVVIVHDRVHGVYRVVGVEAEGALESLSSEPLRRFDIERNLYALDRPTRRFTITRVPSTATNARITGWERKEITPILRSNSELFHEIEVIGTNRVTRLPDEAADDKPTEDEGFSPQEADRRRTIIRQIKERRGQKEFRDALRKRYGDRCLITGCTLLAVLEAAHIAPYRGAADNHPSNGLLLRADAHTLFDLDLLAIEPENLLVVLHPDLAQSPDYGPLSGKILDCPSHRAPSREAIKRRYDQFLVTSATDSDATLKVAKSLG
jgi:hypothetical protein